MAEQGKYDVVVIGAGHNSLIASAYLARCGQKVLVLEKLSSPGGGAVSREVTLPGFMHDTHATSPGLLQSSPVVTHDELGLLSKYGLEFVHPPISMMSIFGDGDTLVWYSDVEATCKEIAKFSPKDAESYVRVLKLAGAVLPAIGMTMARPPVSFGNFVSFLEKLPSGSDFLVTMLKSVYEVVTELFEHPKVRMALLKRAMVTLCNPEDKGTGMNILFVIAGLHAHSLPFVVGGTQNLTAATVRCIEDHGGEVRLNSPVKRVINENGEARVVELLDGTVIRARKAVLASIHPHYLGDMVTGLDAGLVSRAKKTSSSYLATLMVHVALKEPPRWKAGDIVNQCSQVDLIDSTDLEDFRRMYDAPRWGVVSDRFSTGISVPTHHDRTRAPSGKHVLASYNFVPYALKEGGSRHWDELKVEYGKWTLQRIATYAPNVRDDNILGVAVESPVDLERYSASFTAGDVSGVGATLNQNMGMRPTPELSQYRVPGAAGLYLTGPFMHPGGGIGGGGRAVAIRMMEDFKVGYDKVIRV